jgi:hypothetical protein
MMSTTQDYHCKYCGKRLKPVMYWYCVEENEALQRGETVSFGDHWHEPDVPYAEPRIVLDDQQKAETGGRAP